MIYKGWIIETSIRGKYYFVVKIQDIGYDILLTITGIVVQYRSAFNNDGSVKNVFRFNSIDNAKKVIDEHEDSFVDFISKSEMTI